ncbi:hypothetical protein O6H91_17G073400 [Diphasiastrum complanatum]|uniref:Uncharacterized protein n=1 Tax=Diphasiastrum complanatum TaxID=34168 RepID=A0ACC2B849_DIPCM|nr:hypothetical protein O6H91_17G073400 [Diphasiastrum complanatum]
METESASSSLSIPRSHRKSSPHASSSSPSSPEVVEAFFHVLVDPQAIKGTESWMAPPRLSRSRAETSPGNGSSKVAPFSGDVVEPEEEPDSLRREEHQLQIARATPLLEESIKDVSGDGGAGGRSAVKKKLDKEATLLWRDLTVKLEGKRGHSYKVIQSLTGYALPSTLTAIMGPSNSGKSSLLRALAGTLPTNAKMFGEILLNGHPIHRLTHKSHAYVRKGGQLLETLTVRETLFYSALLQLPDCWPCAEKNALVDGVIADMQLQEFSTTIVGGYCRGKGLPLGEKRRLSIALELLENPRLVFVEKPVEDLDSISGFLVMTCLKRLAIGGCTVMVTTEQTCLEITNLFDKIFLLAKGKTLFFGEISACLEHFENSGFPCPRFQNPSDHFLQAINWDFDRVASFQFLRQDFEQGSHPLGHLQTSVIIRTLETAYKASTDAAAVENLVVQLSKQELPVWNASYNATSLTRLAVTIWRSFLNMSRDFMFYWFRCILYIALMLCIGTVYYQLGNSSTSIPIRASAIFFMVSFLSLLAIGSFPALARELQVYRWERDGGHTRPVIFVLGNMLSSIPFLFLISAICSGIGYFLMGFRPVFQLFMYYVVNVFLCLTFAEGLLMVIASVTPAVFEGIIVATSIQIITMLVGGYFCRVSDLPKPVWKYPASYIAYQTYAVEGLLQNEYSGLKFSNNMAVALSGQESLRRLYPNSDARDGKWFNLLILAALSLGSRMLLYVTLFVGEKFRVVHQKCMVEKV